ncbi:RNA polymerase II C-terminal domain phosphatase-like 2 [Cucumis melo var. makuwa]|uniref:RNA polymerase II C-terminal domain phosphatase-like 2 n=1 Tax=Cucumis melo var. makuwa TaxID=1194695 RepID=A0A5D3C5Q0_CUCMM|nr:RNA polymerase II C-terminal domain phosphatase-like 2 [Cucumis melo var. makuwa]
MLNEWFLQPLDKGRKSEAEKEEVEANLVKEGRQRYSIVLQGALTMTFDHMLKEYVGRGGSPIFTPLGTRYKKQHLAEKKENEDSESSIRRWMKEEMCVAPWWEEEGCENIKVRLKVSKAQMEELHEETNRRVFPLIRCLATISREILELFYEDDVVDLPPAPNASSYMMSDVSAIFYNKRIFFDLVKIYQE